MPETSLPVLTCSKIQNLSRPIHMNGVPNTSMVKNIPIFLVFFTGQSGCWSMRKVEETNSLLFVSLPDLLKASPSRSRTARHRDRTGHAGRTGRLWFDL